MYKLSKYLVFTDIINPDENSSGHKRLLYSTRNGLSLVVSNEIYNNLTSNRQDLIESGYWQQLIDMQILVPIEEDEFELIINQNNANNINTLGLVLHTTANCQFGCSYCGQQHTKKNIDKAVVNRVLTYVEKKLQTGDFLHMFIVWHGSEALMSFDDLRKMSKQLIEIANRYKVSYHAKIITNGLSLKPTVFEELYFDMLVTNYQITIDGSKEFHDNRRMLKDGGPTFDIIMNNIITITNQPWYPAGHKAIAIRVNIDKTNSGGIFGLIDLLESHGLQKKISIDYRPVENYVDNKFKDNHGLTKEQYAEFEIELLLYSLEKGFSIPDIVPERQYDACMAVVKDFVVLDIYGNVFPCYNFPYTNHKLESANKIGNLAFDESTFNQDGPLRNWYQEIATTKNACYHCNLLPVCGGYCPLKWQEGEIACPSYKYNIEDRVVLNYLYGKVDVREELLKN